MAAHGSGAVALSRGHGATLLNVDIGGGTTKFALIEKGRILATAAIAVGGRLLVEDAEQGPGAHRGAGAARSQAASASSSTLGKPLRRGGPRAHRRAHGAPGHAHDRPARRRTSWRARLLVTDPWPAALANKGIDALTFSGGVAEYLYKREKRPLRRPRLRPRARARAHAGAPPRPAAGLGPGPGHPRDRDRRRAVLGADQRQHDRDQPARRPAAAEPAGARL